MDPHRDHKSLSHGLLFQEKGARLRIGTIKPHSLWGPPSILLPGDYVEFINGILVRSLDVSSLIQNISASSKNNMSIVVKRRDRVPEAIVKSFDQKCDRCTNMSHLVPVACQVATPEQIPSVLESVDSPQGSGLQCSNLPGWVSLLLFQTTDTTQRDLVLSTTVSKTHGTRLLISGQLVCGDHYIHSFGDNQPLHLMSLNHMDCTGWTPERAYECIRNTTGKLHVLAHNPSGTGLIKVVKVPTFPWADVGISFHRHVSGAALQILDLHPKVLLSSTALSPGDEVLEVSGLPCQDATVAQAMQLLRKSVSRKSLSLLVRAPSNSCLVLSSVPPPLLETKKRTPSSKTPSDAQHELEVVCWDDAVLSLCGHPWSTPLLLLGFACLCLLATFLTPRGIQRSLCQ